MKRPGPFVVLVGLGVLLASNPLLGTGFARPGADERAGVCQSPATTEAPPAPRDCPRVTGPCRRKAPARKGEPTEATMQTIRMEEMTWPAIRAAIDAGWTTVVVAVGSTEQHGPHLPTMTDSRIGDALAVLVARRLGGALVARTIDVGISDHHLAFAGTLSLSPETLRAILRDYVASLVRSGFRRIVFVPTHGGNFPTVQEAIDAGRRAQPGVDLCGYTDLLGFAGFLNRLSAQRGVTAEASGAHAGENETSMMMALEPGLVLRERFEPGYLGPLGPAEVERILQRGMPDLTPNGVLGDPRGSRPERGLMYLERLAGFLVEELKKQAANHKAAEPGGEPE